MTRRDVRRMIKMIATREYRQVSKEAQSGSTQDSFVTKGRLRSMQMQMQCVTNERQRA